MEIQLQELIEQIKKDGVEAAESQADAILKAAEAEAEKIVADAKKEAEKILSTAREETDRMVKSGEDAIRQAGRNVLISFRESVTAQLELIVKQGVKDVYSSSDFSALIVKVVEAWTKNSDAESVSVLLSNEDLKALESVMLASLREKMINGVTLKANDNLSGGFRISVNDDGVYYDYSAEAVVSMMSAYLSPKIISLLKEAEGI